MYIIPIMCTHIFVFCTFFFLSSFLLRSRSRLRFLSLFQITLLDGAQCRASTTIQRAYAIYYILLYYTPVFTGMMYRQGERTEDGKAREDEVYNEKYCTYRMIYFNRIFWPRIQWFFYNIFLAWFAVTL